MLLVKVFYMFVVFAGQIPPTTSAMIRQFSVLALSTTCKDIFGFWRKSSAIIKLMLFSEFLFLVFWSKSYSFLFLNILRFIL